MGRQARQFSNSGIYHIIARGINREHIFESEEDYGYLKKIIRTLKEERGFSVYAYCFMENHIHLIIKEKNSKDISLIMKQMLGRYAMYFNAKYCRSGKLIGNRYKSISVEVDEYFIPLLLYVHMNPVKAGIALRPDDYPYSSCREYFRCNKTGLTDLNFVLGMIEIDSFKILHTIQNSDFPLKDDLPKTKAEIQLAITNALGELSPLEISGLKKAERNYYVNNLKSEGLSVREIERLTGISRGTVSRALKGSYDNDG